MKFNLYLSDPEEAIAIKEYDEMKRKIEEEKDLLPIVGKKPAYRPPDEQKKDLRNVP